MNATGDDVDGGRLREPDDADGDDIDGDDIDGDDIDGDDIVVLAWWQHPFNVVVLLVAMAAIAGMVGWMIGEANAADDPSEVDVGFLQDMREHHEQAVAMSLMFVQLPESSPGLRTVARSITVGQSIDTGRMIQLLRGFDEDEANMGDTAMAWMGMASEVGDMPGMATDAQLDELAAASGATADELFVELMTAHHRGGIHMAEFAAEEAAVPEVRAMATSMAESQAHEIDELEDQLD
jgi:uncharacterized protein (DUF305 family)